MDLDPAGLGFVLGVRDALKERREREPRAFQYPVVGTSHTPPWPAAKLTDHPRYKEAEAKRDAAIDLRVRQLGEAVGRGELTHDEALAALDARQDELFDEFDNALDDLRETLQPGYHERERVENEEFERKLPEAIALLQRSERISTSSLSEYLRVTYRMAARLTDKLEELRYVGPYDGSGSRRVLRRNVRPDGVAVAGGDDCPRRPGRATSDCPVCQSTISELVASGNDVRGWGIDWRGPGHAKVVPPEVYLPARARLDRRRRIALGIILLAPLVGLMLAVQLLNPLWLIAGLAVSAVVLIREW